MILSTVVVGRYRWRNLFGLGMDRALEAVGLALHTSAFIETTPTGLRMSPLFRELDSSEMIGVSYRLGMGLTNVVAQRELGIPWLLHVDRLVTSGAAILTPGQRRRGDLAGQDLSNRWHIVESKGRSSRPTAEVYVDAKIQAAQVVSVNGAAPATNSACVSDLSCDPFSVVLDDPPPDDEKSEKLVINPDKFFEEYYSLANLLRSDKELELYGDDIVARHIPGTKFALGMSTWVLENLNALDRGDPDGLRASAKRWHTPWRLNNRASNIGIGLDGYVLIEEQPRAKKKA